MICLQSCHCRKQVKVHSSHAPHYFVVSKNVLINKASLLFVMLPVMEWSFSGRGHSRRKQHICFLCKLKKCHTLWHRVSFKVGKERETCSVRLMALQLLWRLNEPLQRHSNAGIENYVCGSLCASIIPTEELLLSFLPASATAGSRVPRWASSAWRRGTGWEVPRGAAHISFCCCFSQRVCFIISFLQHSSVSFFWGSGFKALLSWGGWISSPYPALRLGQGYSNFHEGTWHGELISFCNSSPDSAILSSGLVQRFTQMGSL